MDSLYIGRSRSGSPFMVQTGIDPGSICTLWCIWCCSEFGETDSDPMTFHFRFGSLHFAGLEIFDMMIASSHPGDDFRTTL